MRHLSLFSGAGGSEWAALLLGWTTIGYVEFDDYCQRVLAARIKDGIFPVAPIFGDIRAFISDGYAESYQGMVDCISAGFPCQPFSLAGKRAGADDERNMWPQTIDVIRQVRPRWCLLENVPGLLGKHDYFATVLQDLAEAGFDAEWGVYSAADVGAPHRRKRLWIVASNTERDNLRQQSRRSESGRSGAPLSPVDGAERDVAHAISQGQLQQEGLEREVGRRVGDGSCEVPDTHRFAAHGSAIAWGECSYWGTEPDVGRVANGVAARQHRLKALGNGQVPAVAVLAWHMLGGAE